MLTGYIYSITALVCVFSCAAILRCNNSIYERDNVVRSYFSFLLINFMAFAVLDTVWGFMNDGLINIGRFAFGAVSFILHFDAVFAIACWCIFLTHYFGFKENRVLMILQCIPLLLAVCILFTQIIGKTVYVIDDNMAYSPGPFRVYMFCIKYSYYVLVFLKVAYFLIRHHSEKTLRENMLIIECAVIPGFFAIFQHLWPGAPFTSLGFLFSAIIVFNGMMIIEKSRSTRMYEKISKETYMTLEALSDSFVTVIMIDLMTGKERVIKSTPYADSLLAPEMPIRDKILRVFENVTEEEYTNMLVGFADIDTLPKRMENKRSLSMQYRSKGVGWCILSFVAAERDEERNIKKVVLAVQSINETKQKELEYENALSRAYKNENAVLAELIKMQTVGIIATNEESKIIVANDAVLRMTGLTDVDPIGRNVFDFWTECHFRTPVEAMNKYDEIEARGGSFSYQVVVSRGDRDDDILYLMADAKRVDLLDGSKVMVTCFTDVTSGKILEDRLRTLSETDALTGIANRRCGESQVKLLLGEGVQGIYCLLDVDGFKQINDEYGHQTGDDTLVAVARAIRSSFRADDIIMRLGGDEFAIYMRGVVTPKLAKIRIARLFENIARIDIEGLPRGFVNVSLGAVIVRAVDGVIEEDYASIYKRADEQMYKCKSKVGSQLSIEETEDEESQTGS